MSNVSLSSMTIQNNLGSGIRGTTVTGFSLTGSTVSGNGDDAAADEAGIRFDGLLGTASISSTTVSGSVKDNIRIVNSSGTLTSLAITGSTISSNNATTGNDGLTLEANTSANMTVSVTNTNFHDNRARGIKATTNGAGNLDLTVNGGAYTTNTIHVDLADNSTGALTFDVLNTTMSTSHTADGSPINVFQGTGSTSGNMVGTISGNTITNNDSLSGPGISALATGTGQMVVKISGNDVSHVANLGISAIASQGSSHLDATVINNTVTLTGADAAHGITVESGSSLSTDTNAVCAVITGNNSSTTGASQFGIRVRNRQTRTTFSLPGYGGSATNDAAVASFLAAANTASTSASHGTSAGFAGGAACLIP